MITLDMWPVAAFGGGYAIITGRNCFKFVVACAMGDDVFVWWILVPFKNLKV